MGKRAETTASVTYPINLPIKIDWSTRENLDKIALYEKKKRSTMARDIIVEKIQVYQRNPAFKRFLKQLEEQKAKEVKTGE